MACVYREYANHSAYPRSLVSVSIPSDCSVAFAAVRSKAMALLLLAHCSLLLP